MTNFTNFCRVVLLLTFFSSVMEYVEQQTELYHDNDGGYTIKIYLSKLTELYTTKGEILYIKKQKQQNVGEPTMKYKL